MKLFKFTEVQDNVYQPHGKGLTNIMPGLTFRINPEKFTPRVAMLNVTKYLLHSTFFMQTKEVDIVNDMMVDHKYGNTDLTIHPGYRYILRINILNEIIKYIKSEMEGLDKKDIYLDINEEMQEHEINNIFNNARFLNMYKMIRRITHANGCKSDVHKYFCDPLIDILDTEWKPITDVIRSMLIIKFGLNYTDFELSSIQLISLSDQRYEIMDKSIPSKALSEKMKQFNLSSDDTIVTKLV